MNQHTSALAVTVIAALALVAGCPHRPPPAARSAARAGTTVLTVTLATDAVDAQPGDGACEATTGAGDCSIRAAVQEANARPVEAPFVIVLRPGRYEVSLPGDSENEAVSGDIDIQVSLDLIGAGAAVTVIEGPSEPLDHAFEVIEPAVVAFRGVTISGSAGGGIRNRRGQIEVTDCTIRDNRAHFGGGIANDGVLTMTHSVVSGNTGGQGGGIVSFGSSRLTIRDSRIDGNGDAQGGGLLIHSVLDLADSTVSGNLGGHGGGINIQGTGPVVIHDTTIAHNHAGGHADPPWHGYGGGIWNQGTGVTLVNVTLSDNWAQGGGIYNLGAITITSSTMVGNGTFSWGGAINNVGQVWIANSVVGPSAGDQNCDISRAGLVSLGHNLDRDGSCALRSAGDLQAVDPMLGPLADNGGPTLTHALLPGSPAIDAGADARCPATDQRRIRRPVGARCDIGAVEFDPDRDTPTPTPLPTPSASAPVYVPWVAGNGGRT
jgi:hypothetical protein